MNVYLDFDGVLHPDAVYLKWRGPLDLRAPGHLFMHAPILTSILGGHPEVRVILSTSWVRSFSYSRVLKKMPKQLAGFVQGATWHSQMEERRAAPGQPSEFDRLSRFEQITRHVNRHGVSRWLALDDLHSGEDLVHWPSELRDHLVLTDPDRGLSCPTTQAELREKLARFQA
jgi:hypothetical protein